MAAFRGSGGSLPPASNGGAPEVDPALYRNLVEMFPLMESFMVCVCVCVWCTSSAYLTLNYLSFVFTSTLG